MEGKSIFPIPLFHPPPFQLCIPLHKQILEYVTGHSVSLYFPPLFSVSLSLMKEKDVLN